jgi:hypothetical protein
MTGIATRKSNTSAPKQVAVSLSGFTARAALIFKLGP